MAFLIPDNIKSRKDVPAPIQRVAKSLEIALDEKSTLWYEPVFDPSNQKPHFVLLIPDRGIVVLEVFESKASAILGVLRGNIRLTRDGKEIEVENPLARADRFARLLKERIQAEPRLSSVSIPVEAAAFLTSLSEEEARNSRLERIIALQKCMFKPELDLALSGSGEAAILRRFISILKGSYRDPLPAVEEKILRGLIQPEVVIDRVASKAGSKSQLTIFRAPEGEDEIIRVMDRQQEAMAKSLGDGHRIIRGVAGSGKTLVLVYRAKLLAQLNPRKRFLLTCYNRSLAGELRSLLADYPNVTVSNLDRLMFKVIRDSGLDYPGYEDDDSGEKVAQIALNALGRWRGERYHGILLDEAQDFSTNALKFALGLLEPGSDHFIIVADSAQNIYKRKFNWKDAGIQAMGRTRILRINYRNTKQILEYASTFLTIGGELTMDDSPDPEDENAVIPPAAAKRTGARPTFSIYSTVQEEADAVVERVRRCMSAGAGPRSIGVLYGTSRSGTVDEIREKMESAGIDYFWINDPKNKRAKDQLSTVRSPVILSTIFSAKGLDYPRVVLFSLWNDRTEKAENRKLAYVGMTRATHELMIVSTKENPLASDLQKAMAS